MQKINGKWLITNTQLRRPRFSREVLKQARPTAASGAAAAGKSRRLLQRGYNPLVWAVARVPARVRTKLLVAFLAIAALLVVVALLGLRVLGQSNARAARLGTLQVRVGGYRELEADAVRPCANCSPCVRARPATTTWLNGGQPTAAASVPEVR